MNWSQNLIKILTLLTTFTKVVLSYDPTFFKLFLFDSNPEAKCLDGSPYGVYYSPGYKEGRNKVIINFWGGGWCSGRNNDSFLADCLDRSNSNIGSSNFWPHNNTINGTFLGGKPNENINFYNWHRFDFPYCDGTGHQGYVSNKVSYNGSDLYFRGHMNTLEGLKFVFEKIKIEQIDTFAITGCSAGGLATFYWTQYIADYINVYNKYAKVYGFPDSGFFVDYYNVGTGDNDYKFKQKMIYEFVNNEIKPVSKECLTDNKDEPHNCLLAENLFKYITVPFLMIQPGYDTWQLMNILGESCTQNNTLSECDEEVIFLAHEYKNHQKSLIEKQMTKKDNLSVWSPSCLIHCFYQDQQNSKDWQVPQNSGNTIDLIVKKFMKKSGRNQYKLMDDGNWPINSRCANQKNIFKFDKN